MGQSSSNLSKFGIPNKEKLEYERFYDKINLRETKLYEKFVEHTTNNETIVLKFKDKHGNPKFMLEIFPESYQDALASIREDYPNTYFPDDCPFPHDVEVLLTEKLWEMDK